MSGRKPSPHRGAVTVAYVHPNEVAHSWHLSLLELVGWDMGHRQRVMRGGWLAIRCGTDGLSAARNRAAQIFLDGRDAEWLFWVDTDMGFGPNIVDELVKAADPTDRPIVGALCFAQREAEPDGMGGYRVKAAPTIYDWVSADGRQGFLGRRVYEPDTLLRCAATGSAAILIHRSVFARIRDEFGPVWYDRVPNPAHVGDSGATIQPTTSMISEDLAFCMRAGTLGIPVHVHTGIKTTHLKHVWLAEADYLQQQEA